jgi:hypothetical protein
MRVRPLALAFATLTGLAGAHGAVADPGFCGQACETTPATHAYAYIQQLGNQNAATAIQQGDNYVSVKQIGDGNRFDSVQLGTDNRIVGTQNGGVTASIVQRGDRNAVNFDQPADGLAIDVIQERNGASITIESNGVAASRPTVSGTASGITVRQR